MPTKVKFLLLIIPVTVIGFLMVITRPDNNLLPLPADSPTSTAAPVSTGRPSSTPKLMPTNTPVPKDIYIEGLSFSAQAPFGDWKDPIQQDGCEEASVLTAVYWGMGKTFTRSQALEIIRDLSAYQVERYGQARDTSASDTRDRLIGGYFSYSKSEVRNITGAMDIVNWLAEGKLVLVPANGQALNNPNFTPPGPDRHMVVIRGYDSQKREFITNDVGTRQGENYHYPESVLFSAIRDYPTGDHLPIVGLVRRAILVWK